MNAPRAVLFDFNGTLSQDEPILCEILVELFAEYGKPLSAQQYFEEFAGLSDPEIIRSWFGDDYPAVDEIVAERIRRYRRAVGDGASVPEEVRAAVRYAAARVAVGVVSGAAREEIAPVLEAAGLADVLGTIVSADDVVAGKPDPEGYLRALDCLDGDIAAGDVLVLEDTEAGVEAAKAAGMRCVAVLGTVAPARLVAADEIVQAVDVSLLQRLLG
jgi:beta-phosphoglucomutase